MLHSGPLACPSCISRQMHSFPSGLWTQSGSVPCKLPLQVASPGPISFVLLAKAKRMRCVPCTSLSQCFAVGDMCALTSRPNLAYGTCHCSRILFLLWVHSWFNAHVLAEVPSARSGISVPLFLVCAPCRSSQTVQCPPLTV